MSKKIDLLTVTDKSIWLPDTLLQSWWSPTQIKENIMNTLQYVNFDNLTDGMQTTCHTLWEVENNHDWVKYLLNNELKSHDLIDINSFDTLLWLFMHLKLLHKTERFASLNIILEKLVNQSFSSRKDLVAIVNNIVMTLPEEQTWTEKQYTVALLKSLIAHLFHTNNYIPSPNDNVKKSHISRTLRNDDINEDEDNYINNNTWYDPLDDRRSTNSPYISMSIYDVLEADSTDRAFTQFCKCMDELQQIDPEQYVTVLTTIVDGLRWNTKYETRLSGTKELQKLLAALIVEPKKLPIIKLLIQKSKITSNHASAETVKVLWSWIDEKSNWEIEEDEFIA